MKSCVITLLLSVALCGCGGSYQPGSITAGLTESIRRYCSVTTEFEREAVLAEIREDNPTYNPPKNICERYKL